jgi:hypothetical protein
MMNEIQEVKATLSNRDNRSTPLSVAAYDWLQNIYLPITGRLVQMKADLGNASDKDLAELYCQLLEHKWYLSERARRDVGHQAATDDFLENIHNVN